MTLTNYWQVGSTMLATNMQNGTAYTLQQSDAGKIVTCNNPAPVSVIVPDVGVLDFDNGTRFEIWQQGAGIVTPVLPDGVVWEAAFSPVATNGPYTQIRIRKRADTIWQAVRVSNIADSLVGADGFILPEALPVLDQLTQLLAQQAQMIEQQKQTNELLFRLMLQLAGMSRGEPVDVS